MPLCEVNGAQLYLVLVFFSSRQIREKEEELENARGKYDSLRLEMRKAEKQKRELQVRCPFGAIHGHFSATMS